MTRQEVINKVKVEMDELTPFSGGLIIPLVSANNAMSKPIDAYINEILNGCVENVVLLAPVHLLTLRTYTDVITVVDNVVILTMPSDCLAIGTIKLSEWERPVSAVIKETDPLYLRQKNKYTRAGVSRPIVAIRSGVLECYSATTTVTNSIGTGVDFKYRARPVAGTLTQAFDLPDKLIMALVYLTAAKLFKIFEMTTLVQPTMELFSNELNSK